MKKIKSFSHALEVLNQQVDCDKLREALPLCGVPATDIEPFIADLQIKKIVEANNILNDWKRIYGENRGYCVWKEVISDKSKHSGFGFSDSYTDNWYSDTFVGARLEVGTHEEAMYIGKDFEFIFEIAWLIIPVTKE